MNEKVKELILVVDDDADMRTLLSQILANDGYEVLTAETGLRALVVIGEVKPDLILLDVMMPGMTGYEVCLKLQKDEGTASIPVLFLSGLDAEQDKAQAIAAGAVDYLVKPIRKALLLEKVARHLVTKKRWAKLPKEVTGEELGRPSADFERFRQYLGETLNVPLSKGNPLANTDAQELYSILKELGVDGEQTARIIADYLKLPHIAVIDPETVELGALPQPFARTNSVIAVKNPGGPPAYVMSNPFQWELLELLKKYSHSAVLAVSIADPETIDSLLDGQRTVTMMPGQSKGKEQAPAVDATGVIREDRNDLRPVVNITNTILRTAVVERASDLHFEPKEETMAVRFRIDGDMREMFTLNRETGVMVLTRLKAISGLDITERRKPQDGALEAVIDTRKFKLRLATTSTPSGESMIIRLLEPDQRQRDLEELGMTDTQVTAMVDFASRAHGLILIVGPTGSGKTTTIYSLLGKIDCIKRSLISVEDPVEYRIGNANQQQVNEKAGVTFEALLKSSVRQDPDILFIGEVRDQYSARVAVDFASTGHVTITTLHTSNATTAIFRLERLGTTREQMADTILGVVAQRLMKRLCPHCKKVVPITAEEAEMLAPYTEDLPEVVAHPVGCEKCGGIGYYGREGIYEVMRFDGEVGQLVRENRSLAEIRAFLTARGDELISRHAVEKVKRLLFSPKDAYDRVLIEETPQAKQGSVRAVLGNLPETGHEARKQSIPSILVVEDDKDIQKLVARFLEGAGYKVTVADDGIDAMIHLSQNVYSLIISDVQMPNLDGFKFMEIKTQKGIDTPLVFLTSRTEPEDELQGLELGALDFIKKPVRKEVLLLRVKRALGDKWQAPG